MLWIFLLLRRTYTARTGVWPFDGSFACTRCGAQCPARVFAEGFGTYTSRSGADYWGNQRAHDAAVANYHALVRSLFAQAACPQCRQFSPARTGLADHEGAARAASEDSRFTWAATVAGVLLLLGLGVSALDRSGFLALTFACLAVAVGALVLLMKTPRLANVRLVHPPQVAFWWNGAWVAPEATYVVPLDAKKARTGALSAVTIIGASLLSVGSLVGLIMWGGSFDKIYVVNTEPTPVQVRIDGKIVGEIAPTTTGTTADASSAHFDLRAGDHVVEVLSTAGTVLEKRDVPVERFDDAWVYAPRAKQNGACLGTVVTTYKKYSDAPGPVIAVYDETLLEQKFDDELTSSPASVTLDSNTNETTRTALRAFGCRSGHTSLSFSNSLRRSNPSTTPDDD